jgi:hypothetical protein
VTNRLIVYFTWNSRKCTCRLVIRLNLDSILKTSCSTLLWLKHSASFICIILSHLRQNRKLLCPKVVALHIRLQVSITFRIYYLIIHQCNKIISKFTPICLTGSFLPERCWHLWTLLVGLLRHEIVLLPFPASPTSKLQEMSNRKPTTVWGKGVLLCSRLIMYHGPHCNVKTFFCSLL